MSFITSDPLLDELNIPALPTATTTGRKKTRPDIGGDNFSYKARGIEVSSVTTDHCCAVEAECKVVQHLTRDPNPLRKSVNDQLVSGNRAPNRVGGSLAVTRALGDGYLKINTLSAEPYQDFLPYIHSRPTIHYKMLGAKDAALILASDGLFNYISARECANVLSDEFAPGSKKRKRGGGDNNFSETNLPIAENDTKEMSFCSALEVGNSIRLSPGVPLSWNSHEPAHPPLSSSYSRCDELSTSAIPQSANVTMEVIPQHNSLTTSFQPSARDMMGKDQGTDAKGIKKKSMHNVARKLVEECIKNAALNSNMTAELLMSLGRGGKKREIIDDVTCCVIKFGSI